jgi:mono/diheme cytochrome c family protein
MRKWLVIVLCGLGVVFIGLLLAGAMTIRRGFSARSEPSAIEAFVARYIRHMAVPRDAIEAKNPVPESAEVLAEAMAHFADHCAFCHANDGSGTTPIGQGLYPKPPDMRLAATQNLTDGEIFYVIQNGVRLTGMPAFGDNKASGKDEDSWKLVHFIRRLPKITAEELESMKKMNPKSPSELAEEEALERFLRGEDVEPQPEHKHH